MPLVENIIFFCIELSLFLCQVSIEHCSFIIRIKIELIIIVVFQHFIGFSMVSFSFSYKFQNQFVNTYKIYYQNFECSCAKSISQAGKNDILTILHLAIYECKNISFLFRTSWISFITILQFSTYQSCTYFVRFITVY